MNRLLRYLPEFMQDLVEFRELTEASLAEFDAIEAAAQRAFDDQFVMSAGAAAVRRREQMLGIQADPSAETLDFRRKRLINRYSTKPPFTIRYLQQQLDTLLGEGLTVVAVDPHSFILTVTADIGDAALFHEVERTVRVIKPANLIYRQRTALSDGIGLDERLKRRTINWNYSLGSWHLGTAPFALLGPEVTVK